MYTRCNMDDGIFFCGENFMDLALKACENGVKVGAKKYIYDVGRIIGIDRTGERTSMIEVWLIDTLDGIRTVYPVSGVK